MDDSKQTKGLHPQTSTSTDITSWRLQSQKGRHYWHILSPEQARQQPLSYAEKHFLGLKTGLPDLAPARTAGDAASKCFHFFSNLQLPSGHWACEFTGPNIDIPGLVIALYVTDMRLTQEETTELVRYIFSIQNDDGGWGLHIAGESTTMGSVSHYVALRLLGLPRDDARLQKARACQHELGGVLHSPLLVKFWLAVLGVIPWNVVAPLLPDLWLLPDWTPISPWRWWVYPRANYTSISFVWSKKWAYPRKEKDPLILDIRNELLGTTAFCHQSLWSRYQTAICPRDDFRPVSWIVMILYFLLELIYFPLIRTKKLQKRAEDWVYKLICIESENTDYASIASIVAPMALVARFIQEGRDSTAVLLHRERLHDYFWMTGNGMAVNVTHGVQTWDTAFAVQAAVAAGLTSQERHKNSMLSALQFLEESQMDHPVGYEQSVAYSDPPTKRTAADMGYRHPRRGAWGFSDKTQGYPVSDCAAEALKAVLLLQNMKILAASGDASHRFPTLISETRIKWAVDIILTYQSDTGGCPDYEPRRGSKWLEYLNPTQIFDNLMVCYDHPECTGSCLTALEMFRQHYPDYRSDEIDEFIEKAVQFIHKDQRPDGSWKGSWGICFTYAAYFTLEALASQGEVYHNSKAVRRACEFLLDKQNEDGGWGESFESSVTGLWVNHPDGSQVVQTAWALVALLQAGYPDKQPLENGIRLLMRRQQPNGEFLQEDVEGAFLRSCTLLYPNYKFIFPIRALGMYSQRYETPKLVEA